jgi:thiamine biosynthesis lipoprotein
LAALAAAAAALIAAVAFFPPRGGEDEGPPKFSSEFYDTFDTQVTFTAFAPDEESFARYFKIAHDEMRRLHRLFDIYNLYGGEANIMTINERAGKSPVKVDPAIMDLLDAAKSACRETGGAVNVALGPVLAIWHDLRTAAREGSGGRKISIPSRSELAAAAVYTSVDDIEVDRDASTVFLRHEGMRLDVGAIAKGFAVQRTVELLRASGLESGLLNAGGNVAAIGAPLDGRGAWNIGVSAPVEGGTSDLLDVLRVPRGSVVTSGNYQRYFTHDGRAYHHIIDPSTLYPAENMRAVTVLHPDSTTADILSTAAFIMPPDAALALIEAKGAEAMWVTSIGGVVMTDGYRKLSRLGGQSSQDLK